jgi:hypothetical protein
MVRYRLAKKSDIPDLVNLMNKQYLRKKSKNYFVWQYFSSDKSVLVVALANMELIGMFGFVKRELNNRAVAGQAMDLLIDSRWRRKGVFKNLAKKAVEHFSDIDVLCVFPNLNGKNACEKGLGWKTIGIINSMFLTKFNKQKSHTSHTGRSDFIKFRYDSKIREQRFGKHPEFKYSTIEIDSDNFAIVKTFTDPKSKEHYGDIVDFECNDKEVLKELFLKASLHLKKKGCDIITTWALPHTLLHKVVKSLGFVEGPQKRYFCLRVLNPEFKDLYNFSNWHFVQADAEIY